MKKTKKLTPAQREQLFYDDNIYLEDKYKRDYYFCANQNGTDSYFVNFQLLNKETGYWEDKKAYVFDIDGKDKHDDAINIVEKRCGAGTLIKNCTYQ